MSNQEINVVAQQALDIVTDISLKATDALAGIGFSDSVLNANAFTDNAFLTLENAANSVQTDSFALLKEPAFMRIDLEDFDGRYCRSLYVSKVAAPTGLNPWREKNIDFVSYRSTVGSIASLDCGTEIKLGNEEYYISRKINFTPKLLAQEKEWDCVSVKVEIDDDRSFFESFRALIQDLNEQGIDVESYLRQLAEQEQTTVGKIKALTRNIRSGMSLRSQAALDKYQDEIFRLPINSQRIILGPPGTGKTTTLIKRLGQKLDASEGSFQDAEVLLLTKLGKSGKGFNDWLMFTPSELLKSYLEKAFNYEGIVIQDNLKTLDYMRTIARQNLGILNTATSKSGFAFERASENFKLEVIDDPRGVYASFETYIENALNAELKNGLEILIQVSGLNDEKLIEKISTIIESKSSVLNKYKQLFELENKIKQLIEAEKKVSDKIVQEERNLLINKNNNILEDLARFLQSLKSTEEDDQEDDFDEDETDEVVSHDQRSKALTEYQKFLKRLARYRYLRKSLKKNSKDAQVVQWLDGKLPSDERLIHLGRSIALQNGLRHNLNCWKRLYKKPTNIYKKFRKEEHYQHFYANAISDAKKISQAELDLLLLVSLRNIKRLLQESYVIRNIDEVAFQELKGLRDGLLKDQILVDEATDFSALQLACMQAMTTPLLNSFFACGDFNQRLTSHGIKDLDLIDWISPNLKIKRINTIYRQSPKLNEFTHAVLNLMDDSDTRAKSELPKFVDFEGFSPVLTEFCTDVDETAQWITERIGEIETLVNQNNSDEKILPSIVVLVNDEAEVSAMSEALNEYLEELSLNAVACSKGQSVGSAHDVRVCSIEYIKGLEFEAVFFVGIDELMQRSPELYRKFLYVGATRAANYLGMTCAGELPSELEELRPYFGEDWAMENLDF